MAIRKIRTQEDPILRKKARLVDKFDDRLHELVNDMIDTMYEEEGVGLAAPQVGVLKRLFIIDVGDGPVVYINPEIIQRDGEQVGPEGCLSVPGYSGIVARPNHVIVKAVDADGNEFTQEGEELLARAICHEYDHLEGVLYVDFAENLQRIEEE